MEELKINVSQQPGVIQFDNTEIKEALELQMSAYESLEITEDNIPESKKDLAVLRKIKDAIETERKRIKKEYNAPLEEFESKCKELSAVVERPIKMIDGKLKEFEAARIAEKQEHLKELYKENIGEYEEFLPYEKVYRSQWDNKGTTDRDIINELSEHKTLIRSNLDAIRALGSEIEDELIKTYKLAGNDLTAAIKKNADYLSAKSLAEQKVREEQPKVMIPEPVKSEQVVSFVVEGKENIEKARMILSLEDIPFKEA